MRAAGLPVETVSVHRADPAQLLAAADHDEAGRTWNILPIDATAFFRAHAAAFASHPVAYARTLGRAVVAAPPGARGRQLFYFGEAVPLWRHAKTLGATHLHAHLANVAADVCWLASELGKLAAPPQGWRWSFTMHGPTELYSVERFNLRRKVASADGVICISEHTRAQLMYLSEPASWPKLEVVHCGADLARYVFVPPADHEELKVLCVARFVPEKGLDLLLEAIAALCERRTDVRLVLVGEGPLEAHLRRKAIDLGIQDRVAFTGPVGQDDLAQYYAEADVFCLPSFAEGLPIVLMEAMATGRPVVASRIAGIPELVEDGVSGVLVAPGQPDELVAALEMLAASPELRRRMGGAGRARVEDAFDARRNAAQVAAVLRRLTPQCT